MNVDQLRELIGRRVRYQGMQCEIIEILEDGPAIILQYCDVHTIIQPDQHGEARRRVPSTVTIPVLTLDKTELNPSFLSLELIE